MQCPLTTGPDTSRLQVNIHIQLDTIQQSGELSEQFQRRRRCCCEQNRSDEKEAHDAVDANLSPRLSAPAERTLCWISFRGKDHLLYHIYSGQLFFSAAILVLAAVLSDLSGWLGTRPLARL